MWFEVIHETKGTDLAEFDPTAKYVMVEIKWMTADSPGIDPQSLSPVMQQCYQSYSTMSNHMALAYGAKCGAPVLIQKMQSDGTVYEVLVTPQNCDLLLRYIKEQK